MWAQHQKVDPGSACQPGRRAPVWRCVLAVVLAVQLLLTPWLLEGPPVRATGAASSQSYAGQWLLQYFVHCNAADTTKCDQDWVDVPGAVTQVMTVHLLSDAKGAFTFQYERVIAAKGTGVSPQCGPTLFKGTTMTGTCRMTSHGTGFFQDDGRGAQVFWVSKEWITFYGKTVAREVHNPTFQTESGYKGPYPQMWLIPAVPGYHDAAWWASSAAVAIDIIGNGVTTIEEMVVRC